MNTNIINDNADMEEDTQKGKYSHLYLMTNLMV